VQSAPAAPEIRKASSIAEPPRIILDAVEGFGKTTTGALCPNPIFVMARGETGLDTLRGHGLVPDVDTFGACESWEQVLGCVSHLIANNTGHKTIVFDALGGIERLCHEYVCRTQFKDDWGERGFSAYQKGYDLSVNEWLQLLSRLDRLRHERGTMVLFLSHCKIKTFKNPMGSDFDRYMADCHEKTWSPSHKWADAVLFGNFATIVTDETTRKDKQFGKGKGIGGTERVIFTERADAFDAKNRYGMPPVIDVPNDHTQAWAVIDAAINRKGQ
jgi:hypothetical protein